MERREDDGYLRVPTWLVQVLSAAAISLMGWSLNEAYTRISELNTHMVATDLRVTVLEQQRKD